MKATQKLHDLGQSLWLDNITRDLLTSGTLKRYIDELSVTGLTSNPTIFDHAIKNSTAYDAAIRSKLKAGQVGRGAVLRAGARGPHAGRRPVSADLRPDQRRGRLGVAGSLAAAGLRHRRTIAAAKELHARAGRPNLFIKIPGTREGLPAIEEAIFAGVPINVTLLFSREQYRGGGRGVPARHRAAHRRRAEARRRLRRLAVHQPLGRRGRGQGAASAAQPARHRHRPAHLQGVPRAARLAALAARLQRRRPPAAPAVGEHRHQGSQGLRHALRRRRWPRRSRSTPCPRRR